MARNSGGEHAQRQQAVAVPQQHGEEQRQQHGAEAEEEERRRGEAEQLPRRSFSSADFGGEELQPRLQDAQRGGEHSRAGANPGCPVRVAMLPRRISGGR
jgi:hypothetical protein